MIIQLLKINFQRLLSQKKNYMILVMILLFGAWNTKALFTASVQTGIRITPWVFSYYFAAPVMKLVYGFITIALFSEAPFKNNMTEMIEIRCGKRPWICGQILYIVCLSFVYTLAYVVSSILFLIPRLYVGTTEWGLLLHRTLEDPMSVVGASMEMMKSYSPIRAMIVTFLLVWLVTIFLGMIISACRMTAGKRMGTVVAGFLTFISYFSVYVGSMYFGKKIFRFSPVSWIYLGSADMRISGYAPGIIYVFSFLVLAIILLETFCVWWHTSGHESR